MPHDSFYRSEATADDESRIHRTGSVSNARRETRRRTRQRNPREPPTDEEEQANYYEAMFTVFDEEPWFLGYAWWHWPARMYDADDESDNRRFCVNGKQAEQLVRE